MPRPYVKSNDLFHRPENNEFGSIFDTLDSNLKLNDVVQSDSIEQENHFQTRYDWDSGEDYYFQWAKQNRRPVENLIGRKRDATSVVMPIRAQRIKGGIWRSGLVG